MRRPPPLPSSATSRPDAGDGSSVVVDEHPTAPVIPLTGSGGSTAGTSTSGSSSSGSSSSRPSTSGSSTSGPSTSRPSASGGEEAVGLREVWAATRARRRALRSEVRRFTVRQRRRRALWIGVAAALLLLVVGTVGAAYSPLFAVEDIKVVGAQQLDAAAVEAALADQVGTPLPLVDESAVKAALVTFPLVESYTLEARPPHELVVRIVERTPIGYLESRSGFTLVDAAGVALSTSTTAGSGAPLLTVEGGVGSPAFVAVGHVVRSLPAAIRIQVTVVSATTPDDVTLTLGATGTLVVWGSADDSAMKGVVLETMMVARPPGTVASYDVSSPDAVVVR